MEKYKKYNETVIKLHNKNRLSEKENEILELSQKVIKVKKREKKAENIKERVKYKKAKYRIRARLIKKIVQYWEGEKNMGHYYSQEELEEFYNQELTLKKTS